MVDNASTDDSVARLRAEFGADPRLRVVVNAAQHRAQWPTSCAASSSRAGRHVAMLSADDMLLPGHLARALAFYRAHPEVDYLHTGYTWADEQLANERYIDHPGHLGADVVDRARRRLRPAPLRVVRLHPDGGVHPRDCWSGSARSRSSRRGRRGRLRAVRALRAGRRAQRVPGRARARASAATAPTPRACRSSSPTARRRASSCAWSSWSRRATRPPTTPRAALALLDFRERELAAGWPEAYADVRARLRRHGSPPRARRSPRRRRGRARAAAGQRRAHHPRRRRAAARRAGLGRGADATTAGRSCWRRSARPTSSRSCADLPYRDAHRALPQARSASAARRCATPRAQLARGDVVAYLDELDLLDPAPPRDGRRRAARRARRRSCAPRPSWRSSGATRRASTTARWCHVEPLPLIDPADDAGQRRHPALDARDPARPARAHRLRGAAVPRGLGLRAARHAGRPGRDACRRARCGSATKPTRSNRSSRSGRCARAIVDAVHRRAARADDDPMTGAAGTTGASACAPPPSAPARTRPPTRSPPRSASCTVSA